MAVFNRELLKSDDGKCCSRTKNYLNYERQNNYDVSVNYRPSSSLGCFVMDCVHWNGKCTAKYCAGIWVIFDNILEFRSKRLSHSPCIEYCPFLFGFLVSFCFKRTQP